MCGRYRLSLRKQLVEEYFDTESDEPEWTPRYNIAPSQPVPVIRQNPNEPGRELSLMQTRSESFLTLDITPGFILLRDDRNRSHR